MGDTESGGQGYLTRDSVRRIVRVLAPAEPGPTTAGGQSALLYEWCMLVAACTAYRAELRHAQETGWVCAADECCGGSVPAGASDSAVRLRDIALADPGLAEFKNGAYREGMVWLHHDVRAAADWHASPAVRELCDSMGLGECLTCYLGSGDAGRIQLVRFFRDKSDPPFSQEDGEVCRVLGERLAVLPALHQPSESPQVPGLSARMNEVLQLLLKGKSEKQVAAVIGLSRNTVHHHVKAIYLRFGVNSRAELMMECLTGNTPVPARKPPEPVSRSVEMRARQPQV